MRGFKEIKSSARVYLVCLLITGVLVFLILISTLDLNVKRQWLVISGVLFVIFFKLNNCLYLYKNLIIDELTKVQLPLLYYKLRKKWGPKVLHHCVALTVTTLNLTMTGTGI